MDKYLYKFSNKDTVFNITANHLFFVMNDFQSTLHIISVRKCVWHRIVALFFFKIFLKYSWIFLLFNLWWSSRRQWNPSKCYLFYWTFHRIVLFGQNGPLFTVCKGDFLQRSYHLFLWIEHSFEMRKVLILKNEKYSDILPIILEKQVSWAPKVKIKHWQ